MTSIRAEIVQAILKIWDLFEVVQREYSSWFRGNIALGSEGIIIALGFEQVPQASADVKKCKRYRKLWAFWFLFEKK